MKKVLVIGCARSGYWVSLLLNDKGYDVTITDKDKINEKEELINKGISVYDEGHPDALKTIKWDFIVKNPGIAYHNAFVSTFVEKDIPIYAEIEVASWYASDFSYGAITGTNGKTTITTLLYELLKTKGKAYASGNIGIPLSETLMKHDDGKADIALEISAFQLLGCPTFRPLVSVITNLTSDHLDYFENIDEYFKAKTLVYRNQKDDDWFIKNIDDQNIIEYCDNVQCKVISMSIEKKADLMVYDGWVTLFDVPLFNIANLRLVGKHNLQNAMMAAAMAYKMGVLPQAIDEVIFSFDAIEHRIEYVTELNGVKYYNDSKGTNTDSTVIALKSFDTPVILLAGGYDKHTGFSALYDYTDSIKKLIVFGATKTELAKLKDDAIICMNLKEATDIAYRLANEGDIVLFSPACASYDQFNNYEERGRIFKQYVQDLASREGEKHDI